MREPSTPSSPVPQTLQEALQRIAELEQAARATESAAGPDLTVGLLRAIGKAQKDYIATGDTRELFAGLLNNLLSLTQSEYGFIGEVLHAPEGQPYLKTWAITNIAWDEATRRFYDENAPKGLEFANLKTLFGAVILSGKPLITNDPANHPKRSGIPSGHPPLRAFMGLPFFWHDTLIGMVGIANRPGGYTMELAAFLEPFLATCGGIINAARVDRQRRAAETALRESEARQRALLAAMPDMMMRVNGSGVVLDYKPATEDLIEVAAEQLIGKRLQETLPQLAADLMPNVQRALAANTSVLEKFTMERSGTQRSYGVRILRSGPDEVLVTVTDITDRVLVEEAAHRARLQEEIIRSQEALLSELSTPLIPISDSVVIMPLIGTIDTRRAQQLLDTLLEGIQNQRARVAILDITGVTTVDTMIAGVLVNAASAARMLGAQVILTGLRAEVARSLVHLGVDLGSVVTRASLQSGVAYAIGLTHR